MFFFWFYRRSIVQAIYISLSGWGGVWSWTQYWVCTTDTPASWGEFIIYLLMTFYFAFCAFSRYKYLLGFFCLTYLSFHITIVPVLACLQIEVLTGEESEEVLFAERAKLFRFIEREWKERGIGTVKILKNVQSGTSRVLMRRDQVNRSFSNTAVDRINICSSCSYQNIL